jgi:hypothetical protein
MEYVLDIFLRIRKKMIRLKSSISDSSVFEVYNDNRLIGHIRKLKGLTGNRYIASIEKNGQEVINRKSFDSPDDALYWIESHQ